MIRKTLLALAATAVSLGSLAATSTGAAAGTYGYNYNRYVAQPHVQVQVIRYQPIYKTVCQPVYKTVQVWDAYHCRWTTQTVFLRNDCWQVQVY